MLAVAVAVTLVAVVLAVTTYLDRQDKFKEMALSLAAGMVEEGIAVSEIKTLPIKREAVINATKVWQKKAPEVLKDQIQAEKFLQDSMMPARDIAHTTARNHIGATLAGMPNSKLKAAVKRMLYHDETTLDQVIKIRIIAAKINIADPVKPFLYRYL